MTDATHVLVPREAGERVHDLKTWPSPFAAVRAGLKPWELRLNDRDYQVGDLLNLREWRPPAANGSDRYEESSGYYTGEVERRTVVWMLEGRQFGLPAGYVIMSLAASPVVAWRGDEEQESGDLDRALSRAAIVEQRLARGQKFNLYETDDGYAVCLGPITDKPLSLATVRRDDIGELIVEALRAALYLPVQGEAPEPRQ